MGTLPGGYPQFYGILMEIRAAPCYNDRIIPRRGRRAASRRCHSFMQKTKTNPHVKKAVRVPWLMFQRVALIVLLLLVQAAVLIVTVWKFSLYSGYVLIGFELVSVAVSLYVLSKRDNPSIKLVWVLMILLFPVFGGLFYLLLNFQSSTRKMRKRIHEIGGKTKSYMRQDPAVLARLLESAPQSITQARYLRTAGFPVYENTAAEYLTPGEKKLERLLEELHKAEHFIFLEYFIIEEGRMWDSILAVLIEKARAGVEVRVMYDDMGSLFTLPARYDRYLEKLGIRCVVFNRFRPLLSAIQNNRDHRKIAVIDGHTAFTGGINLADEYINAVEKHGHWKDASILIRGDAAWSFTLMFLQMWELYRPREPDIARYHPRAHHPAPFAGSGFAAPYADSPLDAERVGENVYLNMIAGARRYLYIATPYLIIGSELITALSLAAKSGVDVRILTPHRWDKRLVHITTRSYYPELLEAGVRIYEYTRGFIHSKTFVSDDRTAAVGTVNLDYRSLYLHFECGVWIQDNPAVLQVRDDFIRTLDACTRMTAENSRAGVLTRLLHKILQIFAPLM